MSCSKHFCQRAQQRGIGKDLIALVEDFGTWKGDSLVLPKKALGDLIEELERRKKYLVRARDKGGLVIIVRGDTLVTTYPLGHAHRDVKSFQPRRAAY